MIFQAQLKSIKSNLFVPVAVTVAVAVGVAAVSDTARDRCNNATRLWQMKWRQMQFNFSGTMRRMRIFNTQVGGS